MMATLPLLELWRWDKLSVGPDAVSDVVAGLLPPKVPLEFPGWLVVPDRVKEFLQKSVRHFRSPHNSRTCSRLDAGKRLKIQLSDFRKLSPL
jgi:hypothetical protein